MRNQYWIEFLLAFSVFLIISILLLFEITRVRNIYLNEVPSFFESQKLLIASIIEYKKSSNETLKNFNDPYYAYLEQPLLVYLNSNCQIKQNSLVFCWNNNNLSIIQNGYYSKLTISIFSENYGNFPNIIIYNSSATYYCRNYSAIYLYKNWVFYTCDITMNGNSIIYFYPFKNVIIIKDIYTQLDVYNGDLLISKGANYVIPVATTYLYFYDYKNNSIFKRTYYS